ncbi:MAG: hypothetical protein WCS97_03110 [Candidatus Paceibacterota bacterium]|jgi:hypothetical protein
MIENAISMEEPKKRLANLKEFMPKANDHVLAFGRFLAEYLNNPELVPQGFVMGCELALYDLRKGVHGFTGNPIQSSLVGYPPMIYRMVRMEIPRIADAVFPEDFASGVKAFMAEVNASVQKSRATG